MRKSEMKKKSGLLHLFIVLCLLVFAQVVGAQFEDPRDDEISEKTEEGMTAVAAADESRQATLLATVDKADVETFLISYDDTICPDCCRDCCSPLPGGLDHVAAGVGTRNAGYGTIHLQGAPDGAVAVRATLYWGDRKSVV